MTDAQAPVSLTDWYELVRGATLMQGDILEGCSVFRPPADLQWPVPTDTKSGEPIIDFEIVTQDVIVLSQSCDLVPSQKSDVWLVLLCPLWKLSEAAAANSFLGSSYGQEDCRRGNMAGYHMLAGCDDARWTREVSIVSFREVCSLPLSFVTKVAAALGPRPRMRAPYREHLAQAFARYFMRVGLPTDIPSFTSSKDEREAVKRLKHMDEEARRRIFESVRDI